jgi:hypothetical protein
MAKEIMPVTLPDPEISRAQETTMKLLREFSSCQDPLTKKAFRGMVYDALEYEKGLRSKLRAEKAVKQLHEILKPAINSN